MASATSSRSEQRLVIFTPRGRDAQLIAATLAGAGIGALIRGDFAVVVRDCDAGVMGLILAEECLGSGGHLVLAEWLRRQPTWSDLPILLLTRPGADSALVTDALATLGNVTLLERPTRGASLLSAVRAAIRARQRQYQVRDQLRELEELSTALADTELRLMSADRRKDEFLATLAHELRNPLAPIRNALHLLALDAQEAMRPSLLAMMDRQVGHLVRLVDDLLEISRITRGKIELQRARVAIADVLRQAIETSLPAIEAGRHRLTVELPAVALYVDGDRIRLAQVLSNLLNNSAKYTDEGGRITVRVHGTAGQVVVEISDNGIGIDPELLPRVFDLFTQAQGTANRSQGGLGIGLTLVRTLVEMHGGTVEAHSKGVGQGSRFVVRLAEARLPEASATSASTTSTGPIALRVMVVDDNVDAADSMAMLLRNLGASVAVAHGGREALEQVDAFQPDLLFVDIGMPEVDGFEVARSVRERRMPQPRLVALTGWGQREDVRLSNAAGFDQHLVKPVAPEVLARLLQSYCPPGSQPLH